jgi:hypothetical protein
VTPVVVRESVDARKAPIRRAGDVVLSPTWGFLVTADDTSSSPIVFRANVARAMLVSVAAGSVLERLEIE